jgi:hypothetical protein
MHTVQQQNARIYLDQQYLVEEDVAAKSAWPASVWGGAAAHQQQLYVRAERHDHH